MFNKHLVLILLAFAPLTLPLHGMNKNINQEKLQLIRNNDIRWYLLSCIGKDEDGTRSLLPKRVINKITNYLKPELTPEMLAFLKSRMTIPKVLKGHENFVYSVAFNHDGTQLASGSSDTTIRLWDLKTSQCLITLKGHKGAVFTVVFNHEDTQLASGSWDKTIRLWNLKTGQCLKTLKGHTHPVKSVAFNHDETQLASGSNDTTIRLWNPQTGECFKILNGHTNFVSSVSFNRDSTQLASGSWDKTIRLWDPQTGQCLKTLNGHKDFVYSVAFNHDQLISVSRDLTIRVWDPQTGQCLEILKGHECRGSSVAFSPDGTTLAGATKDKAIRLWNVKKHKKISYKLKGNQFTLEETTLLAKFAQNQGSNLTQSQCNKLTQMEFELT